MILGSKERTQRTLRAEWRTDMQSGFWMPKKPTFAIFSKTTLLYPWQQEYAKFGFLSMCASKPTLL
jgi:hypothetical protein